ncbi:carboxypeptidase-like regulatory domain-containing protein, partial [Candidatus Symbiothrix dinenymphae]|uniref:carboxypeptidase-like regulatory domain-containing protein n=1 Tax=Candidatus Symbiothrix dinenymphae TaxID=467085 RepID=UPI001D053DBD
MVEAVAQDILVRGVVVNEKQRPLPGVAVSVDGEPSITDTTDAKGTFTLYVPRSAKQLVATCVGMRNETVNIAPQMRLILRKAFSRNEFSVHAGVGASSLWNYSPNVGNYKFSVGYDFGIGYTLFFSKNKTWAVSTGISIASFNSNYELPTFTDAKGKISDGEGGDFDYFDATISGYTESQHLSMLTIPLMLHFEKEMTETGKFYAALGVKFGLPRGTINYTNNVQELHASGTIRGREIIDPESMGLGNVNRNRIDLSGGSIDNLQTAYFVSVETGMKWALTNEWSLYTGIYMDYGFKNIIETGGNDLVGYNAAEF